MTDNFTAALYGVSPRIRGYLEQLPESVKDSAQEIRLRTGQPIALTVCGETVFVGDCGFAAFRTCNNLPKVTAEELEISFNQICDGSVFSHEREIKNGFVAMEGGCRAGICGTLTESGFIRDITSINIRIAHQVKGSANDIAGEYAGGGLLIAGPPGCGKTTVLRDLIRQLSSGERGKLYRIAVIDSRREISGVFGSHIPNDLGFASDLLITENKAKGIELALRTMFPDIIAFDEIGSLKELQGVTESFNSGVSVITTAHIGSKEELLKREITARLIKSGAISQVALLPKLYGGSIKILTSAELE